MTFTNEKNNNETYNEKQNPLDGLHFHSSPTQKFLLEFRELSNSDSKYLQNWTTLKTLSCFLLGIVIDS